MKRIILTLKKTNPGTDEIRTEIFRDNISLLAEPIPYNIHKCFENALIIPIFKNRDPDKVDKYIPIALINSLSKMTEKVIKIRLEIFLTKCNIISPIQYGFRNGL